jgi:hypothetical protein
MLRAKCFVFSSSTPDGKPDVTMRREQRRNLEFRGLVDANAWREERKDVLVATPLSSTDRRLRLRPWRPRGMHGVEKPQLSPQ